MVIGSRFALTDFQHWNSRHAFVTLSTKLGEVGLHRGRYIPAPAPGIKKSAAQQCKCRVIIACRSVAVVFMFSRSFAQLIFAPLLLAGTVATAGAQQTAPIAPNQPQATRPREVSVGQSTPATANAADSQAVAYPAYLTPVAGYQGVLAETIDGATIASQAVEEKFNPAKQSWRRRSFQP